MKTFFYKVLFFAILIISFVFLGVEISFSANIMLSDESNGFREVYSLNGKWELSLDREFAKVYRVNVPGCIGVEVEELRDYTGEFYYKKNFTLKTIAKDSLYYLYFGSINYYSQVWVNGQLIGFHEGGYTPFSFDITDKLRDNNEILIKVLLPSTSDPNYPFPEIPHGKQSWYGTAGGILGDVFIIKVSKDHIKNVYITPDIDNSRINVKGMSSIVKGNKTLLFKVYDPKGQEVVMHEQSLIDNFEVNLLIKNPVLWDIDNPKLYKLEVSILDGDEFLDKFVKYFGLRKIEAKNGEILFNNKPIYIMGALDQDFYPDTHYIPPNEKFVKDQLVLAKEMGLNCLRYHIKVPHPWYLKWADRLGILVWYDMPNWDRSTSKARSRGEKLLEEMVAYDYNHPSVVIRTIINESWGLDLVNSREDREWLKSMYNKLKSLDATRLVVDNSPCCNNFHVKTDINDFHNYFAFPDRFSNMKSWLSNYATSPQWTFGYDSERKGDEPLLVSEFGNWGLPDFSKLRLYYKGNPWWFNQGNLDNGTNPMDVEKRFRDYGLDKIFTPSKFAQNFQELQHQALRFQIEEIRKYPQIKGYIITEFTDLYWECNGLLDITRGKKSYFRELKNMNSLDLVFPKDRPTSVWSGEDISIPILFSNLSDKKYERAFLRWQIIGTNIGGILEKFRLEYGLNNIGTINFKVPSVNIPRNYTISLGFIGDGKLVSRNFIELFVVPRNLIKDTRVKIAGYDKLSKSILKSLGLKSYDIEDADIIYSTFIDKNLEEYIRKGKKVILEAQFEYLSYYNQLSLRRTGVLEGNWVGGIGIISPRLAGKIFPTFLDYRFMNDMPNVFLAGNMDFGKSTLSGMVIGWITNPMNFMVEVPLGKGKIIIHTFPIINRLSESPVMNALLYQIIGGR